LLAETKSTNILSDTCQIERLFLQIKKANKKLPATRKTFWSGKSGKTGSAVLYIDIF
jgi:hypothetical protein